ncbi:hypothetical protein WJX81_005830 [Elliptochloris bilobata]|uniref:adenylate kinase n=1 Tax=Elliptochloris bilobata TaxID=381761 RepID=A0AAW1S2K8_9CHLO
MCPNELGARIAKASERNLRRALLILETCRVAQTPLQAQQALQLPDWELYIQEIAGLILKEQSPRRLFEVRGKLYELLVNCIPPELILRRLAIELLPKLDDELKHRAVEHAAFFEHRLQEGQKAIYHLEAFVARCCSQNAASMHTTEQKQSLGQDDLQAKTFQGSSDKVNVKAQVVFDACWRRLEEKHEDAIQCPKEIVWLNGAPGSGKGVNTKFILSSRGLTRAVTMSSLLERHPGIRQMMDNGELVPDTMVGDALLDVIFDPEEADAAGLVIDGFPRTALQADFLKLLFDKMMSLHHQFANTPNEWRFPRPSFKVVVLYVEQEESVRRQVMRAQLASLHNQRVLDAGAGDLWELRSTDIDIAKCRRRYEVFKQHYTTLLRLKQYFPFSLIDAMGSLDECKAQIARELRYQSSLDLDESTYAAIRHLPLAKDLVRASRQQLVAHLDTYSKRHPELFRAVVGVIDAEAMPVLKRCSLAGHAELKTRNKLFSRHPLAADMLIDILTDRGFSVAHVVDEVVVPERVDLRTGAIACRTDRVHHFRMTFERQGVREMAAAKEARDPGAVLAGGVGAAAIGQTLVPSNMPPERFGDQSDYARAQARHERLTRSLPVAEGEVGALTGAEAAGAAAAEGSGPSETRSPAPAQAAQANGDRMYALPQDSPAAAADAGELQHLEAQGEAARAGEAITASRLRDHYERHFADDRRSASGSASTQTGPAAAELGYEKAAIQPRLSVSDPAYSITEATFADAPDDALLGGQFLSEAALNAAHSGKGSAAVTVQLTLNVKTQSPE